MTPSKKKPPTQRQSPADSLPYPRPGQVGGGLIREFVSTIRLALAQSEESEKLPISSHILIGLSGGADSLAMALLLRKYGRRVIDPTRIRALHINHGWRGAASDQDERFVRSFCRKNQIPLKVVRLRHQPKAGESWEDSGRQARKAVFDAWIEKSKGWVLTAHHADDLAETVLWRLMTGTADSHGGGVALADGHILRPLLRIRKSQLQAFLKEEGQEWCEDQTNHEGRFLRSRMRTEIFPGLERLFPRAVERLMEYGLRAQVHHSVIGQALRNAAARGSAVHGSTVRNSAACNSAARSLSDSLPFSGLGAAGLKLRRSHWEAFKKLSLENGVGKWEIHLPSGWVLRLNRVLKKSQEGQCVRESWVFERDKPLE